MCHDLRRDSELFTAPPVDLHMDFIIARFQCGLSLSDSRNLQDPLFHDLAVEFQQRGIFPF